MKTETLDFDLHGMIGIRLIDATPKDVAVVKKQLGPIQKVLDRKPDILIRFVKQIPVTSTVRYLGVEDAGFSNEAFFIFRGLHKTHVKVQIPFDQIGKQQCEIICESGLSTVPLLIAIINMTALSKGILPLHASALLYNNQGILLTGWSKGGKTETLLAFAANGAKYIGDEWIYLSGNGQSMYGIPEPTRIWHWHLQEMPQFKAMASRKALLRLEVLNIFAAVLGKLETISLWRNSALAQVLQKTKDLIKRQLYVFLPPEKLFGQKSGEVSAKPEKLFLVASHEGPEMIVQHMDSQEVAQRMVFSLQEERMEFLSYYWKFRFAFPECANVVVDQAEEIQRKLLLDILAGKESYVVYHPYPFSIPSLFEAIRPYC